MHPIVVIPARLAAIRLPGKPLLAIGGRPMILHVLDRAREADVGPVVVAAGDQAIVDVVRDAGFEAVLTDPALPSGSDRVFAALRIVDPDGRHNVVVNLQADLPSIPGADLRAVLGPLGKAGVDIATLAAPLDPADDTLSVVKVAIGQDGRALYFSRAAIPWGEGPLWHHVGLYAFRRAALERFVALPPSPLELREKLEQLRALEAGMTIGCATVARAPWGVDTPDDLTRIRAAMVRA